MRRSPALLLGVASGCIALDQWSKVWATRNLAFRDALHVIGDLVTFTYTRNSGIAFGMFQGKSFPFYIFSVVAAFAVVWLWARHPQLSRAREWSLALILGGAIGNLIDRVRYGEVTDFIQLGFRGHYFPVFNVADMCVTFGVILFALVWTHDPEPAHTAGATPAESPLLATGSADAEVASAPAPSVPKDPAHASHGSHPGTGSAGDGRGSALGPVAGEGPDRAQP